jgi:hypothetical protein
MKLIYRGPHEAVTVLATGQKATRGETIEIDDDAVAASLVVQGWEIPKPSKPTTTKADEATKKENV